MMNFSFNGNIPQLTITCLETKIETLEKGVKYGSTLTAKTLE